MLTELHLINNNTNKQIGINKIIHKIIKNNIKHNLNDIIESKIYIDLNTSIASGTSIESAIYNSSNNEEPHKLLDNTNKNIQYTKNNICKQITNCNNTHISTILFYGTLIILLYKSTDLLF